MKILKKLFGKSDVKIHVDEIAVTKKLLLGGAVIVEEGDNANGRWIKFGDGTMICYGIVPSSSGISVSHPGGYRTDSTEWYFPQSFVGTPVISRSSESISWGHAVMGEQTTNQERCSFAVIAGVALPDIYPKVSLMAVGPWK